MFSPSLTGMISIIAPPFLMRRKYRNSINNVTNKMRNFYDFKKLRAMTVLDLTGSFTYRT